MINDFKEFIFKTNDALKDLENEYIKKFNQPEKPVFFIVGVPRSGTTVLLQTIINHFDVGYINNFIAKFWEAPVIGSIFFKSMGASRPSLEYHSKGGFTSEVYGPHEFGYFWKRFFKYGQTHVLDKRDHKKVDKITLNREISGLEYVSGAPFIFKNPAALSLQIDFLSTYIPNSYFIYIKRDPFFISQSLYLKRLELFKDPGVWYSVKPIQYPELIRKTPVHQIAGQVFYSRQKIEEDLYRIQAKRVTFIDYAEFCENPEKALSACDTLMKYRISDLSEKLKDLNFKINKQVLVDRVIEKKLKLELAKLFDST
jgi:hypothetical protein